MDYESDSSVSSLSSLDVDYSDYGSDTESEDLGSDYESQDSGSEEDNIEELRRKISMFKKRLLQK